MNKYHFIFDKTVRAQNLKKTFKNYKNFSIKKSDLIIVAGGDGFMLNVLKKLHKAKKPFYGINCGTVGFLMNKFSFSNLDNRIKKTKAFTINPLQVKITNTQRKYYNSIAINEISLLRQSRQTAILKLKVNKKNLIKKLICDGVLVSTPAGSTAYNLSVHGPILSLNSNKLAITPISPFRPRRWKGRVVSDNSKIIIENQMSFKRPVAAVSDNNEVRNVKKIEIRVNKKIKINLLFDKEGSLSKKIKQEQRIKN